MFEAILFIWLGSGDYSQLSTIRYENVEICEEAKKAVIINSWTNSRIRDKNIHCIPVKIPEKK